MDRRLGRPLPCQLANPTRVHLIPPEFFTPYHAVLCAYAVLAAISNCYPPVWGRLPTRYSPVRRSVTKVFIRRIKLKCFARLACVKHAASVHPEPGSNSHKKFSSSSRISLAILSLFYCFLGWCFRIRSLNSFSKTSGTLFFRSWTIPKCSRIPAFSSASTREQAPVCLPLKPPALRAWKSVFMNFQGCFTVQLSMFFVVLFSTACLVYQNFSGLSRTFSTFFYLFHRLSLRRLPYVIIPVVSCQELFWIFLYSFIPL